MSKWTLKPLTALALAAGTLGLVLGGKVALDATNAFAAGEAAPANETAQKAETKTAETGPPMCLPVDLAKEAGISAAEFRLLQALQERRQQLDQRERDVITRDGVITAADQRIQARMAALREVEAGLKTLLGQVDEIEEQRLAGLVQVYEKMKAKDAATVMEGLDNATLRNIAQRMKPTVLAGVMAKMTPGRARELTRMLAEVDEPDLSALANAPAAAPATPASAGGRPPAAPPAKGGQQAASGSTAPASGTAPPAGGAAPARTGAGPSAPAAPSAPAPRPPSQPKADRPAANPASGQAPADPAPKAG
jgi:flagellar motility protein MotE (MotC chaperone)